MERREKVQKGEFCETLDFHIFSTLENLSPLLLLAKAGWKQGKTMRSDGLWSSL
jgi:hypothetical protein